MSDAVEHVKEIWNAVACFEMQGSLHLKETEYILSVDDTTSVTNKKRFCHRKRQVWGRNNITRHWFAFYFTNRSCAKKYATPRWLLICRVYITFHSALLFIKKSQNQKRGDFNLEKLSMKKLIQFEKDFQEN